MNRTNLTLAARRCTRLQLWHEFRTLLAEWLYRLRSRNELRMLDDRELSDIGLTRIDAYQEANKPFWRP
jgi:uncharacterized protein YjiS (DUF1127 family)